MNGEVVHAQGGKRSGYRPIRSPLCASSEPREVVSAFLQLYDFINIYIADLDAIRGDPAQTDSIASLIRAFPQLEFWLDAGFRQTADVQPWQSVPGLRLVLGTESLASIAAYQEIAAGLSKNGAERPPPILSLDSRRGQQLGPAPLFARPALWPRDLIAMNLDTVGSGLGPDLTGIRRWRQLAPAHRLYAAGGVRGPADLKALAAEGIAGVLLASALHKGAIGRHDLRSVMDSG
jgi:phosphoribosylformimino-5-aminoimidazole carboxamide ribotide isomerase